MSQQPPNAPRPRRSIRSRILRAGLALGLALPILYAALPWLIPNALVARKLSDALSRIMNRPASVGGVHISWRQGVVIDDLRLLRRIGFGDAPFLTIHRLRCDFSPLRYLITRKTAELTIVQPQCWVVLNEDGQLNIGDLYDRGGIQLPAYRYRVEDARIHVENHQRPDPPQTFHVGSFLCQLDPETGQALYEAAAHLVRHQPAPTADGGAAPTRFQVKGQMTLPTLRKQVHLSGGGTFTWDTLDLSTFPVGWLPVRSVKRLAGRCSGKIHVNVDANLTVDFDLETRLNNFRVYNQDYDQDDDQNRDQYRHPSFTLNEATLTARGRWDPSADDMVIRKFELDVPDLFWMEGKSDAGPAIRFSQRSPEPARIHVAGVLRDPARVWAHRFQNRDLKTAGTCDFDLTFSRKLDQQSLRFSLDADRVHATWADKISLPAGRRKRIDLAATLDDQRNEICLDTLRLQLAGFAFDARATLPLLTDDRLDPQQTLDRFLRRTQLRITASLDETTDLTRQWPALKEWLPELNAKGSARITLNYDRLDDVGRLHADLRADDASAFSYPPILDKPPGHPLHAWVEARIPLQTSGQIRSFRAGVEHGPGRFSIQSAAPPLRYAVRPARRQQADDLASARKQNLPETPVLHLAGAATATLENAQTLWTISPWLVHRLQNGQNPSSIQPPLLADNASLDTDFDLTLSARHALCRLHTDLFADELVFTVPSIDPNDARPSWRKTPRQRGRLAVDYLLDHTPDRTAHHLDADLVLDGLRASLNARSAITFDQPTAPIWPRLLDQASLRVHVLDIQSALAYCPQLTEWADQNRLTGGIMLRGEFDTLAAGNRLECQVDLSALAFAPPGRDAPRKPAGLPCRFTAAMTVEQEETEAGPRATLRLEKLQGTFAACNLNLTDGHVVFTDPWDPLARRLADPRPTQSWIHHAALTFDSTGVFDASLRSLSPVLDRFAGQYDLIGSTEVNGVYRYDATGHTLHLAADASRTHFQVLPHFVKSVGEPLYLRGTFHADGLGAARSDADLTIETLEAVLWDMHARLGGNLQWGPGGPLALDLGDYELTGKLDVPDLTQLTRLTPKWAELHPAGAATLYATVASQAGNLHVKKANAQLDDVRFELAHSTITIDGGAKLETEKIHVDHLDLSLDESRFQLAGTVHGPPDRLRARLAVHAEACSYDTLTAFLDRLAKKYNFGSTREENLRRWIRYGRNADLDVDFLAERFTVTSARSGQLHDVRALSTHPTVRDAKLQLPFRCSLNGGVIEGDFSINLADQDPAYDLRYSAVDVRAAPDTRPIIEDFFVGMTVDGKMTIIDSTRQYLFDKLGRPNHEVGTGEMVIENGSVAGRAAPLAVTRIFPQLNLARYEFSRMRNWFVKHPDGRHDNRMIYTGSPYNLYMDGYTTADGKIHYEVGIDLLARLDSKYWADSRQGRIPLFTKDGQVGPDGKLIQETVKYMPPWRIVESLLVRQNVVYTAYLALRKRLTEAK